MRHSITPGVICLTGEELSHFKNTPPITVVAVDNSASRFTPSYALLMSLLVKPSLNGFDEKP